MADMMNFPKRWEDFLHDYEFEDARRIYTNGSRLIPSFRVKQMMEHYATVRHGRWEKNVRGDYSIVCSECGYGFPTDGYAWLECNRRSDEREHCFQITDVKNYCPNCGARMDLPEQA